jgi:hypothetical protein
MFKIWLNNTKRAAIKFEVLEKLAAELNHSKKEAKNGCTFMMIWT